MTTNNKLAITIIVATSDEFEDCWGPFFTLFKRFWPNCEYPIILTTAKKTYSHPGLNIECSLTQRFCSHIPTWSERLLFSLDECVKTNITLLLLDDFFLTGPVDETTISNCYKLIQQSDYSSITLTNYDTRRIFHPTRIPLLSKVDDKSPYRITTSPALWTKPAFKRYLRPAENIWMFEIFGTRRSYRIHDSFCRVNESAISDGFKDVIPYFQSNNGNSGIIKGKWQIGISELFDTVGIQVNYEVRGYHRKLPSLLNKYYLAKKLMKEPKLLISGLFGWF